MYNLLYVNYTAIRLKKKKVEKQMNEKQLSHEKSTWESVSQKEIF